MTAFQRITTQWRPRLTWPNTMAVYDPDKRKLEPQWKPCAPQLPIYTYVWVQHHIYICCCCASPSCCQLLGHSIFLCSMQAPADLLPATLQSTGVLNRNMPFYSQMWGTNPIAQSANVLSPQAMLVHYSAGLHTAASIQNKAVKASINRACHSVVEELQAWLHRLNTSVLHYCRQILADISARRHPGLLDTTVAHDLISTGCLWTKDVLR